MKVGRHLNLPASKVFGVATFYNQFRFSPIGKFHIQVCRGTACHVKGSKRAVVDAIRRTLKVGTRPIHARCLVQSGSGGLPGCVWVGAGGGHQW
jgi:NADH:ubiquinone oxidoreductase subunit E